jgi:thiol:disulfide interchange protein
MKRLSFLMAVAVLLFVASCTPSGSTTKPKEKVGIEFIEGKSYEAILAKAQQERKPILIDFYTTWCAPCKWLEQDVFALPQVSQYYNKNIINYKVNAEDFDGVTLAQQYEVGAYPTLIYITQDGEFIRKHEGTTTASSFMEWGREAVIQNDKVR